jgi:APA family basic amino acid/polyamine antiporter
LSVSQSGQPTLQPTLQRRLTTRDAVVIGLGAMIGAGVFAAYTPAAEAAGAGLLIGLAVAAVVAYCNATSSAWLAALYPQSGGTYVYGRERLGDFWGYLAGWGFVVGKTASCAAMALTVGFYAAPGQARLIAVAAVIAITALNYLGIQRSAVATRVLVAIVLAVLAVVVAAAFVSSTPAHHYAGSGVGTRGILQSAAFLFFAFAGYARIATLGEEVRDPARTIPRAIPIALGITLAVYVGIALALLHALGAGGIASTKAPLVAAVPDALGPVVRIGAVLAALGSLLALLLGVSRTTFAMARDHHLPGSLAAVHRRFNVPHRAELLIGVIVVAVVALGDVRGAIGFSSFTVLTYYAVANASALTLNRRPAIPIVGLLGCVALATALPVVTVLEGLGVLAIGALAWLVRRNGARNA